jgi:hypothetical protein
MPKRGAPVEGEGGSKKKAKVQRKAATAALKFIPHAQIIHGTTYDYSKVVYSRSHTNVVIICSKHGEFAQTPGNHLQRAAGCPKCASLKNGKLQTEKAGSRFIIDAKKKHGAGTFDYSDVDYVSSSKHVTINCHVHGPFTQKPNAHLCGRGCALCGAEKSKNRGAQRTIIAASKFKEKAMHKHNGKYNYDNVVYGTSKDKVPILCAEHGVFYMNPNNHLQGKGCTKCRDDALSMRFRSSCESFIRAAQRVHEKTFSYEKVVYKNSNTKVTILCKTHGEFTQTPGNHLSGKGCKKCSPVGKSNVQMMWLRWAALQRNTTLQTWDSDDGEFAIPTTNFKADGYCAKTNTIFEFHGDIWHGNPARFAPDFVTYFHKTAGELYAKTLAREETIRGLGYNLVVMWEKDWTQAVNAVKKLQRAFRPKEKKK